MRGVVDGLMGFAEGQKGDMKIIITWTVTAIMVLGIIIAIPGEQPLWQLVMIAGPAGFLAVWLAPR